MSNESGPEACAPARRSKRFTSVLVLALVVTAAVVGTHSVLDRSTSSPAESSRDADPEPKALATFYRARDLNQLRELAPVVVVADVTDVEKGPTRTFDDDKADRAERAPSLPSDDVHLRVVQRLSGEIEDEPIWSHPRAPGNLEVAGDPGPVVGERYLLFLQRHDLFKDRWVTPTLDGRLRVDHDGGLKAMLPGGVAEELQARSIGEVEEMLR